MTCVNPDSTVYYSGKYWNDLGAVREHMNRLITGDATQLWYEHFKSRTHAHFSRALMLNCGNGWVERELLEAEVIDSAVGIDYSEQLLADARAAAAGRPLSYLRRDVNVDPLPEGPFDLVVNFAAAHHIARLNKVFRELCRVLPTQGWMVSFDYVGPHRNQWDTQAWKAAHRLNSSLPLTLQQDLKYPHLPTMLQTDPTEAVHSELVVPTFDRYFEVDEFIPVGGALAYLILTHNTGVFSTTDVTLRDHWVERVIRTDAEFLRKHPGSSLFAYFSGRPKKAVLGVKSLLAEWSAGECDLERRASENAGMYYPLTPEQVVCCAEEARRLAEREQLQTVHRFDGGVRRAARSRLGRALRSVRLLRAIETWVRHRDWRFWQDGRP